MSDTMNDISIVNLFETIDNVENSNDKNDKIIEKVRNKLISICGFYTNKKRKREREKKEQAINRYKVYLEGFKKFTFFAFLNK